MEWNEFINIWGKGRFKTSTHATCKSLERKIKYDVLIFEIEGVIGNENGRHRQTKLMQQIMIPYLINYLSSVPLQLSSFSSSSSLSTMCILRWSLHCWQSQNSEQLRPTLRKLHLLYLHCTETHLQHVVCGISSGAIFIPVGRIIGLSNFSLSFLSQPYSHKLS